MCADWTIKEHSDTEIPQGELDDSDIDYLNENYSSEISIEAPSVLNDRHWIIRNRGFAGHIELPATVNHRSRGIELRPGVKLSNIFHMLEYAYDLNQFNLSDEGLFDSDNVKGFYDRIANILAQNVIDRRKRGLYRSYIEQSTRSQTIRGRIDFAKTLQKPWEPEAHVNYNEMTANNEENQILLYTLNRISASGFPRSKTFQKVRQAIRSLRGEVNLKEFQANDCANREYNRLNKDYRRLHALCRLILDTSGPSHEAGDRQMIPYTVSMNKLFERFVFRWLDQHLPSGFYVDDQVEEELGDTGLEYQIDLVIYDDDNPICVLDTKYREPDSRTPKTSEVNQVLGYALRENVSRAFLVYPVETDEFHLKMGRVTIKTLKFGLDEDLETQGKNFLEELGDKLGRPELQP